MKFEHIHLDDLYKAYAACILDINNETVCLVASKEKGHPCYMYSGDNFDKREVVWENGGGVTSIIKVPGVANEFIAIRDFYLNESPSKAKLVWAKYDNTWTFKDIAYLPYVHHFDILSIDGENYLIAATIADDKDFKDDWSRAGSIYMAKLEKDFDSQDKELKFELLANNMFKNHGYYRYEDDFYFSYDRGILKLQFTKENGEIKIKHEKVLLGQIGEIALKDLDKDGKLEMITIEPYHGNSIKIYHLNENNKYEEVFKYPYEVDFAHALVGATINNQNCFVGGVRRLNSELFIITYEDNEYKVNIIDKGAGPSNLMVGHKNGNDFIISANHSRNEAAVYFLTK